MCFVTHMRMHKNESPADVTRWLADRSAGRWPAILGSLSLRRSPCIRENCQACRSGEQHPSYVLYGRRKGRRFSVYIPEELVPEVRRCLDNGRACRAGFVGLILLEVWICAASLFRYQLLDSHRRGSARGDTSPHLFAGPRGRPGGCDAHGTAQD